MVKHWKEYGVPTYIAVSGYLGLTKPTRGGNNVPEDGKYDNLEDLERMFSSSGGMIQ